MLSALRAGRRLRCVQLSPRCESSVNIKSTDRAPTNGKCQPDQGVGTIDDKHQLTPFAQVEGLRITYPPEQATLM